MIDGVCRIHHAGSPYSARIDPAQSPYENR